MVIIVVEGVVEVRWRDELEAKAGKSDDIIMSPQAGGLGELPLRV